ncbi:hypothetical protein AVEN_42827-1 [Araneus ventricosus]|uniref:Uncharacterized protein n=1 Tax=Araneus ventricosus TaxID=182803 RepID=A0A4Y2AEL6_ARAVE|nr:hypothetical protein AVEN_42827-1 [Araneus ventricosus]
MNKKSTSVINRVNDQRAKEISKNRAILASIIKTVMFCAWQKIALPGHWESGLLKEDSNENEGNFRAALRIRIGDGDEIKKNQKHLKDHPGNASYISPETQNFIIEEIGELLQEQIVKEVAKAEFFGILLDGTTDCSVEEQLRELEKKGVDKKKMRGQGYDRCAVMSGHTRGVQAIIKDTFLTAFYILCASHTLNLVVNEA